eukprot:Nitzschia sp. Nitz4//scaffold25_size161228//12173//13597//NITZ4_002411-RA/size161228-augustus-gene-0.78-mRNA-1//1//CDS//3329544529//3976//frame0
MVSDNLVSSRDEEQPLSAETNSRYESYDRVFFGGIVRDAGRWAFGVVFVEVWVLNEAKTHLFRPDGGWWIDHYATDCGHNHNDPGRADYLAPTPLPPGCGLPGVLFAELKQGKASPYGQSFSHQRSILNMMNAPSCRAMQDVPYNHRSPWRRIQPIANDPDQPFNPRLKFFAESGLGWAAGSPFHVGSSDGLVLYFARETADLTKLEDQTNLDYLSHATQLIGTAYAMRVPRITMENARRTERAAVLTRIRRKLAVIRSLNQDIESFILGESTSLGKNDTQGASSIQPSSTSPEGQMPFWEKSRLLTRNGGYHVKRVVTSVLEKSKGANVKPPPTFTWEQSAWSFVGAFVTLAILTKLNEALIGKGGLDYAIVLGPFGALMTLQYGLTAAPASQPRNAIVGQTLALLIAQGIGQIENMEVWLKMTLATSLAIGVMVKVGVTHPESWR